MNKAYRIIWNKARKCLMVVGENAKACGKGGDRKKTILNAVSAALLALGGIGSVNEALGQSAVVYISTPTSVPQVIGVSGGYAVVEARGDSTGSISATISSTISNAALSNSPNVSVNYISNNSGLIQSTNTSAGDIALNPVAGIYLKSFGTVTGGITNSGTISATQFGIGLSRAKVQAGLNNSGSISGGTVGISLNTFTTTTGTITSSYGSTITGGLTNAGVIAGGDYSVSVSGRSALDRIVISGVNTAQFNGDVYAPNTPVTIAGGSTYAMGGANFTVSGFNNSGVLVVAPGSAKTITGADGATNYTQAADATYRVMVSGTATGSYGSLGVQGNATFAGNTGIDVRLSGANANIGTGTVLGGVFRSTSTISAGAFTVTDNSALLNFSVDTSNPLELKLRATTSGACAGTVSSTVTGPCYVAFDSSSLQVSVGGTISSSSAGVQVLAGLSNGASVSGFGINNQGSIGGAQFGIEMLTDATLTGGITNTGVISSPIMGIAVSNASLAGGIANAGTIVGGSYGLAMNGSILSGGLTNSGSIAGGVAGLAFNSSNLTGGIKNNGTVQSAGSGFLMSNTSVAGGITNTGILSGVSFGGAIQFSSIGGNLQNTGTITGSWGLASFNNRVSGSINNSGSIQGNGLNAATDPQVPFGLGSSYDVVQNGITNSGQILGATSGVLIQGSSIGGQFYNSGNITGAVTGLQISGADLAASITNTAGASIVGALGQGIVIDSQSTVDGISISGGYVSGISSAGTISAANTAFSIVGGSIVGGINNAGVVNGLSVSGLSISSSTISGGINNAGTIAAGSVTGAGAGLSISASNISGDLQNSGVIFSASSSGLILSGSTLSGSLISSGTIATVNNVAALSIAASRITGDLNNSGVISGYTGAVIANSTIVGSVANSGTITAFVNPALQVNNSSLNAGLTNSGSITNIAFANSLVAGGLNNSGVVAGTLTAISVGNASQITGGLTNSGIISGSANSLNVASGASLDLIAITGRNTAQFNGAVYAPTTPVTIAGGAIYTLGANFTVNGFNNGGILGVSPGVVNTITGSSGTTSYNQSSASTYLVNVNGPSSYGSAHVSGIATFGSNSGINLRMSGLGANIGPSAVLQNVFSANTINSSGFIVIDNSALLDFTATSTGTQINITAASSGQCAGTISGAASGPCNVGFDSPSLRVASTGTITSSSAGVQVLAGFSNGAATSGFGISNQGSISGAQYGIQFLSSSSLTGGVTNTGVISSAGIGIKLSSATVVGGITNSAGASIVGSTGNGIVIDAYSNVDRISNNGGYISGISNAGYINSATSLLIAGGTVTGSINNSGSIVGSYYGAMIKNGSSVSGGIDNSGLISGGSLTSVSGLAIHSSTVDGGLNNSGSVAGKAAAISMQSGSLLGGVTNSGSIQGNTAGLKLANSSITGGVSNTGLISGGAIGISVNSGSRIVGGINNLTDATISSTNSNNGVQVGANSVVEGIINSGYITSIANFGTIAATQGVQVLSTGGFSSQGGINNSGLIAGFAGTAITVSGLNPVNVSNLAAGTVVGAINGNVNLTNSGLFALQNPSTVGGLVLAGSHLSSHISGSYIQTNSGTLQIGVTGSGGSGASPGNFSTLVVDGAATFSGNTGINVNISGASAILAGNTLQGVITAGNISSSGFIVTDNSALLNFNANATSSAINLVATASNACAGTVAGAATGPCLVAFDSPSLQVNAAGTISSATAGIQVLADLSTAVSGFGINNEGSVSGTQFGIEMLNGATLIGGITNSGVIQSSGVAIKLSSAGIIGGISNRAGASISGAVGQGLVIDARSSVDTIVNAGYINGVNNAGHVGGNSSIALLIAAGGTIASGIVNSGVISSSAAAIKLSSATVIGGISNRAGASISGAAGQGIVISANSSIDGITNAGYISGITNAGSLVANTALKVSGGTIAGGVNNSGLIAGLAGNAISISGSSSPVSITNAVSGSIIGGINGSASVNNSGLWALQTLSGAGGTIVGGSVTNASISGNYTQASTGTLQIGVKGNDGAGTLAGYYSTLRVGGSATFAGSSPNIYLSMANGSTLQSGDVLQSVIVAGGTISASPFLVDDNNVLLYFTATNTGNIVSLVASSSQACSGTVSSAVAGPCFVGYDSPSLLVDSSGTITSGSAGIQVLSGLSDGASVSGFGINNQGSVSGATFGLQMLAGATLTGGITNSGVISSSAAAIKLSSATIIGGISNRAGASISGAAGQGIVISANSSIDGITNAGYISGITNAGSLVANTALKVSGGTIAGGVNNSGLIAGLAGNAISISGSSSPVSITNAVSGSIIGGINGSASVNNSGLWALQTLSGAGGTIVGGSVTNASISGNYTQASTGTLQIGVKGTNGSGTLAGNYSTLNSAGTATFASGATINVVMNNANPIFAGGSLIGVVTATAITDPLLNITDNSALINFTEASHGSGTINLLAVAANGCTGTVTGAVTGPCLVAYDSPSIQVAPAGVITSASAGIQVLSGLSNGASVSGFGINNQGAVSGTDYGIQLMSGATLIGGITNSGVISSSAAAIKLSGATIVGGINNRAGATISGAAGQGIVLSANSSLDGIGNNGGYIGGITNAGNISANIGIANTGARIVGGINNTGVIAGASYGVMLNVSTMTGDFINSGTVSASSQSTVTGTIYSGIYVVNSSIEGQIQNTGRISGGNAGIFLLGATVSGGITNSGVISGGDITSWDSSGLNLGYSNLAGNVINNAGATISGGTAGFNMYHSTLTGALMNYGLIQGTTSLRQSSEAVWIGESSLVTGDIANTGSIIGVLTGISLKTNSTIAGAINSSGLISGATGIVVSNSNIGGGITNSGVITGLGGNAVSIVSSPTTNLTNAASGTIVGAINGNANVSNSGLWALQTASGAAGAIVAGSYTNASISGNYTQTSGATLQVGVNGTNGSGTLAGNYSTLNVSGTASFASGSTVSVSMNNAYSLLAGATLTGVVTAGTLSGASNVRVVDNSALLDFTESTAANANRLDIVAYASPTNNIVNAVLQNNNPAALGAAIVLQGLSTNTPPAMQGVIGALNAMPTTLAVSNAVSQTLPTLVGAGSQATAVNQQNLNQIMQGRQNQLRGLSSGEEYIGNKEVWLKGFGSWANQGSVNNVSGYKINTGGLAIGADRALSPTSNLGGVFAFGNSSLNSNNSAAASTLNINSYQVGVYGDTFVRSDLQVNYQADAGLNSNKETRNLSSFTGVSGVAATSSSGVTANGNYNSLSAHLGAGLKKFVFLSENTTFIPSLRADYTSVQSQGYTETGAGSLNLKVNSQNYNMLVTSADFRVDQMLMHQLKLSANVGLGYNLLNNQVQATSTYQGGGAAFTTNGLEISPWLYNAGLGLSGRISKEVELNVRYDTQFSTTGYNNQMVSGKIKFFY